MTRGDMAFRQKPARFFEGPGMLVGTLGRHCRQMPRRLRARGRQRVEVRGLKGEADSAEAFNSLDHKRARSSVDKKVSAFSRPLLRIEDVTP